MQVTSASSQAVFVSVSVAAAGTAAAASPEKPHGVHDRPPVERGDHGRHHRHDHFKPSNRLQQLFQRIDSNGDGGIDVNELGSVIDHLKQRDPSASLPAAEEALATLDRDGDGTIGRRELKQALQSRWRERVQEFRSGGVSPAPDPRASSAVGAAPAPTPVAPPPASPAPAPVPTDGLPTPPESSGEGPAGQFVSFSATVVTIAIRAYTSVAQAATGGTAPSA